MCLIAVVPPKQKRTRVSEAWLTDVYTGNPDGFGFMWWENGKARATRKVGTLEQFKREFRGLERKIKGEFAFHVRYKTHGKVDLNNAHPYPVDTLDLKTAKTFLMHNGVLRTGNSADARMSDTWHFISDYLRELVVEYGEGVLEKPAFRALVQEFIGNNRFVMLGPSGMMHIYNKAQGITWRGMWLSNTYAWDAEKFGAVKPRLKLQAPLPYSGGYGYRDGRRGLDALAGAGAAGGHNSLYTPPKKTPLALADYDDDSDLDDEIVKQDDGSYRLASLRRIARSLPTEAERARIGAEDFLDMLHDEGYSPVAESLSIEFLVAWIESIGQAEFYSIFDDVSSGVLDPAELFAGEENAHALPR